MAVAVSLLPVPVLAAAPLPPPPEPQPAEPEQTEEQKAAEAARKRGDQNAAAYDKISRKQKGGQKATDRINTAVDAYEEAYALDSADVGPLESAAALLGRHLDQLAANKSKKDVSAFELRLQRIHEAIEAHKGEVESAAAETAEEQAKEDEKKALIEESLSRPPPPKPSGRYRKFEWGYQRPAAKWKWAGVGIALVFTGAGLGLGIVGRMRSKPGSELEHQAFALAAESLVDMDDENDVDPTEAGNICSKARQDRPGMVGVRVNPAIGETCDEADNWETISIVGFAAMGAALAGLAVFTTLLFVHRGTSESARVRPTRNGLQLRF